MLARLPRHHGRKGLQVELDGQIVARATADSLRKTAAARVLDVFVDRSIPSREG